MARSTVPNQHFCVPTMQVSLAQSWKISREFPKIVTLSRNSVGGSIARSLFQTGRM
ncbi:MAG: hypothetical protein WBA24_01975 [Geitlerinemataceae cyanobacterium]